MRPFTFFKRTLYVAGGIILALILLVVCLLFRANYNEKVSKEFLGERLSTLAVPESCTEKSRRYQVGGVDTISTWYADLACDTSGGKAYDFIVTQLTTHGFVSRTHLNYAVPDENSQSIFYSFQYSDGKVEISYRFSPQARIAATEPEALRQTPVKQIHVTVTRAWKGFARESQ